MQVGGKAARGDRKGPWRGQVSAGEIRNGHAARYEHQSRQDVSVGEGAGQRGQKDAACGRGLRKVRFRRVGAGREYGSKPCPAEADGDTYEWQISIGRQMMPPVTFHIEEAITVPVCVLPPRSPF